MPEPVDLPLSYASRYQSARFAASCAYRAHEAALTAHTRSAEQGEPDHEQAALGQRWTLTAAQATATCLSEVT